MTNHRKSTKRSSATPGAGTNEPEFGRRFRAAVIGASAGGMAALDRLLPVLPATCPLSIVVVQHVHPFESGYLAEHLAAASGVPVAEAEDKHPIRMGRAYVAPANYHLLVERDETFSLSVDPRVNFARPSIDVLFESAALAWGPRVIGVLLTGANRDGARGLRRIRECGGLTIVQDPATAESPVMPEAAIEADGADRVMSLEDIGGFLLKIVG